MMAAATRRGRIARPRGVRRARGSGPIRRLATDEQRQRILKLLSTEIGFVPHPSFRHEDDPRPVASVPPIVDPMAIEPTAGSPQMPAHLARLVQTPLLSASEERQLFRRMNHLKYLANGLRGLLDPGRPDVALLEKIDSLLLEALAARDQLVRANMRLTIAIVKRFTRRHETFDDLLSDGVMTLMRAVEKFDFSRGFRFSTYAYRALTSNIRRAMMARAARASRFVGFSELQPGTEKSDDSSRLAERAAESLSDKLNRLLGTLDARDRFIVSGRFSLGTHTRVRTLRSLAEELGLSKERVRQLEQRALAKLRELASDMDLERYVEPLDR